MKSGAGNGMNGRRAPQRPAPQRPAPTRPTTPRRAAADAEAARYRAPRWIRTPLALAALLVAAVAVAGVVRLLSGGSLFPPAGTPTPSVPPTLSPTPTLTPTPTPAPWLNPILAPATLGTPREIDAVSPDALPSRIGLVSDVFDVTGKLASFLRSYAISFGDPSLYNRVPGVLTFRGNNFRSAAAYGTAALAEKTLAQVWERPVGSLASSQWSFSWSGTGWTGQPVIVQWPEDIRKKMTRMYAEKRAKVGLKEVISATMDGNIYFYDLDDGTATRDPIGIGAAIKGTPAIDPRGYPLLYVGQGDFQPRGSAVHEVGWRIFSLIDDQLLYFQNGIDGRAYRQEWGSCDSSPIIDADTDTLIWPSENGMVFTYRLHTDFDRAKGTISIDPEPVVYRYEADGMALQGIESSASIYGHYAFFSDNGGILNCLDLTAMKPVWSLRLPDDSDVTPTLDFHAGKMALYTATEVDWQQDVVGTYKGASTALRIDPLTGKTVWSATVPCYTKNAANVGDDINGGALGSPVVGKKKMSDLVVFTFCMTNGIYSGNRLVAFDKETGKQVWTYEMLHYSWSSPVDVYDADGNPYLVICDSAGQIHLVDGLTGQRLFVLQAVKNQGTDKETSAKNFESSPAVFGDMLVVGSRGNVIVGVKLQ